MKKRSWFTLAIGAMTMACTSSPIRPAADQSVVSVPRSANCAFDETYTESRNCCVMKAYRTHANVDDAYASVVREYGFQAEPREYELESEAYPDNIYEHRHETRFGRSYRLQGLVVPRNDPRLFRGLWLGLDLRVDAPGSTEVAPVYCAVGGWSMENQSAWHNAVQHSIRSTLPPTD
jgi:hypothetical protein